MTQFPFLPIHQPVPGAAGKRQRQLHRGTLPGPSPTLKKNQFGCIRSWLPHSTLVGSLWQQAGFSPVVAHHLSCPSACEMLVPRPGIEPSSPALAGRLTSEPPGKSLACLSTPFLTIPPSIRGLPVSWTAHVDTHIRIRASYWAPPRTHAFHAIPYPFPPNTRLSYHLWLSPGQVQSPRGKDCTET